MRGNGLTIPEESLFRRIPKVLEPRDALLLEAFVYAADTLDVAFAAILDLAEIAGSDLDNFSRVIQVQLLNNAWSIVDALHNARQILKALHLESPEVETFLSRTDTASGLRNAMDHIKDQARNLAIKKKAEPPLLGAFSYNFIPPEAVKLDASKRLTDITHGFAITTTIGRLSKKTATFEIINPAAQRVLRRTVMGLQLEAFDMTLELEEARTLFFELAAQLELSFRQDIDKAAHQHAEQSEFEHAELMSHHPSGLTTIASWRSANGANNKATTAGDPA